jgi:hypothetical protein
MKLLVLEEGSMYRRRKVGKMWGILLDLSEQNAYNVDCRSVLDQFDPLYHLQLIPTVSPSKPGILELSLIKVDTDSRENGHSRETQLGGR